MPNLFLFACRSEESMDNSQKRKNNKFKVLRVIYLQEAGVEKELVNLLCRLSAQHYLPVLARHRITTKTLQHMMSSDLKKVCLGTCSPQVSVGTMFSASKGPHFTMMCSNTAGILKLITLHLIWRKCFQTHLESTKRELSESNFNWN